MASSSRYPYTFPYFTKRVKGRGPALHPAHRLREHNTITLDTKIVYLHYKKQEAIYFKINSDIVFECKR